MVGVKTLTAIKNLNNTLNEQRNSFDKLSSGKRITKASVDPAGLAIATALASEAATLDVGTRNARYSQSALDIAGGALNEISNISSRLGELATQAANGALSDTQRTALNEEYQQLSQEITRIAATTEFNGVNLLQGANLTTQVGIDSSADSTITVPGIDVDSVAQTVVTQDISSQAGAQSALTAVNNFVANVSANQGQLGSVYSRLDSAIANNEVSRENKIAAASRIEDVDFAAELAKKVSLDIKAQAGVAISASANQSASVVLNLLK